MYANLFDPTIKDSKVANQAKLKNLLPMRRFVNENVVGYLIQTCQFKFINYFLVAMVNDLQPAYATDNDYFLSNFTLFATPESLKKVATCVRLGTVQIVDCSLRRTLKSIPSSYFSQTALWTLLQAQLSTKDSSLLRTFQQQRECPIEAICTAITETIPSQPGNTATIFLGLQQFVVSYNALVMGDEGKIKDDRAERGL